MTETLIDELIYPSSDGKPMADSDLQRIWMEKIIGGLDYYFRDEPLVYVAGDLLWYPEAGNNRIGAAPDTMVVFGRPKGLRESYIQHQEGGIAPQVVFEIMSESNDFNDQLETLAFYDQHGPEEYYLYDPRRNKLYGWTRQGGRLQMIAGIEKGWTSPRLGIRLLLRDELILLQPDGQRLQTYFEIAKEMESQKKRAEREKRRADRALRSEKRLAEQSELLAEKNRLLAEKLKSLGIDPDTLK